MWAVYGHCCIVAYVRVGLDAYAHACIFLNFQRDKTWELVLLSQLLFLLCKAFRRYDMRLRSRYK